MPWATPGLPTIYVAGWLICRVNLIAQAPGVAAVFPPFGGDPPHTLLCFLPIQQNSVCSTP